MNTEDAQPRPIPFRETDNKIATLLTEIRKINSDNLIMKNIISEQIQTLEEKLENSVLLINEKLDKLLNM
jgi:hypothetical protein